MRAFVGLLVHSLADGMSFLLRFSIPANVIPRLREVYDSCIMKLIVPCICSLL